MLIRLILVVSYLFACLRYWVAPWRYWRLNLEYFDHHKGIFSKQDINALIPPDKQLDQWFDDGQRLPSSFPVFIKPEWGQNSQGVRRIDNLQQLQHCRQQLACQPGAYLIQIAATQSLEFEVFVVNDPASNTDNVFFSITQTLNRSDQDLPVNGIHNHDTYYEDVSKRFNSQQKQQLWQHLKHIGQFRICRYGIRANSMQALIAGDFKIFEINLLLPMPLVLISNNTHWLRKIKLAINCASQLAYITKTASPNLSQPGLRHLLPTQRSRRVQ